MKDKRLVTILVWLNCWKSSPLYRKIHTKVSRQWLANDFELTHYTLKLLKGAFTLARAGVGASTMGPALRAAPNVYTWIKKECSHWHVPMCGPACGEKPAESHRSRALHTGAGVVRADPHCGIRMRETVHTGAGLGAESREHFIGLFICFLISTRTKWPKDSWPSQDIRLSHQISCKHNPRSMLGISNINSIAIIHHTSCICITQ